MIECKTLYDIISHQFTNRKVYIAIFKVTETKVQIIILAIFLNIPE